jgi:hypothetical protein
MEPKKIKKWSEFKAEEKKRRIQYGLIILKVHNSGNGMSLRSIAGELGTSHQHVKNLIAEAEAAERITA